MPMPGPSSNGAVQVPATCPDADTTRPTHAVSARWVGTARHGSGENLGNGREKHNKPRADGAGKAGFLTPAGTVGFPYCSAAQVLFM